MRLPDNSVPDGRRDNDVMRQLRQVAGLGLQAVDVSGLMVESGLGEGRLFGAWLCLPAVMH